MKKKHKFLKKFYKYTRFPHQYELSKDMQKRIKKIKHKYGIDMRDCWNMDFSFYTWLYEHIKTYEKLTVADIDDTRAPFVFDSKSHTQRELMHKILKRIELYFKTMNETEHSEKIQKKIDEIIPMWQILMPAMWW